MRMLESKACTFNYPFLASSYISWQRPRCCVKWGKEIKFFHSIISLVLFLSSYASVTVNHDTQMLILEQSETCLFEVDAYSSKELSEAEIPHTGDPVDIQNVVKKGLFSQRV